MRGFGVVEYESAEQAEAVLIEMDRTLVGGQEVRLSLCTPGTSGRSTLAALIAAQGMVSTRHGHKPANFSNNNVISPYAPNDLHGLVQEQVFPRLATNFQRYGGFGNILESI